MYIEAVFFMSYSLRKLVILCHISIDWCLLVLFCLNECFIYKYLQKTL